MNRPKPERWSSRLGFILATMGSAIGLGSIWKFPYEVGENGGAGFILFYLLGLVVVVFPLLLAEFAIGQRGQGDALSSIATLSQRLRGGRYWWIAGALGIAGGVLILGYYAVIGGLTLAYGAAALRQGFAGMDGAATQALFDTMVAQPISLSAWQAGFLALTVAVVARGISGGIEAACRILMPVLILLLVALAAYAVSMGDVRATLAFLFQPRFEAMTARMALEALGLGFFSIGVGMGAMITYAGHAAPGTRLTQVAVITMLGDTAISLTAGIAIFPLVFAHGLAPAQGASLMFVTLPIAFGDLPQGRLVGVLFFLALLFAALASAISLLELALAPVLRRTGWRRAPTALLLGAACWLLGLPVVLAYSHWSGWHPLGWLPGFADAGVLDAMDRIASNLLLPLGGVLIAAFAGFTLRAPVLARALGWRPGPAGLLAFTLRWIVPGLILLFLLAGHGV